MHRLFQPLAVLSKEDARAKKLPHHKASSCSPLDAGWPGLTEWPWCNGSQEIDSRFIILIAAALLCTSALAQGRQIADLKIIAFRSEAPDRCRGSDVALTPAKAQEFFKRAKQIDARILHDNYDLAPCYMEGTLKLDGRMCDWKIRAGATGHIQCDKQEMYFACQACGDLFDQK
jgi:hypothetical protein